MTQDTFNELPLLLRRSQVLEALPSWDADTLYAYREDEDLRTFQPDPESSFAYYYKSDVARIHGRGLEVCIEWEELPEWLRRREFMDVTGLARHALDRACATGMLAAIRRRDDGNRRFYREDLRWFL